MASLNLPTLHQNPNGWGPADDELPDKYKHFQKIYQPFSKKDSIGRVADWTGLSDNYRRRRLWQSGMPTEHGINVFMFGDQNEADFSKGMDHFTLVNNDEAPKRPPFQKGGFNKFGGRTDSKITHTQEYQNNKQNNTIKRPRVQNRNFKRQGRYGGRQMNREPSVKVQSDWKQVELLQNPYTKKQMKQPVGTDILTCGTARAYNKGRFDKINVKTKVKLDHTITEKTEFQNPNTMDDGKFREILKPNVHDASKHKATILGTDNMISTLMCMSRSQIPWDLTLHKKGGYIVFDNERKEDEFDPINVISVSETANEQMAPDDNIDEINKSTKLIAECTMINQTTHNGPKRCENQN